MSLWKVPDQQTQELMEEFYRRLLAGEPRSEVLRQAQLTIRARYPEPFRSDEPVESAGPADTGVDGGVLSPAARRRASLRSATPGAINDPGTLSRALQIG